MKKLWFGAIALWLVALSLAVACAPKAPPAPPAAPAPAPIAPVPTPAAAPTPTAADEWQKVVEAAKREGMVTLYTFGLTGDPGVAVAKAFEQAYGIKVETVGGVGTVLIERIKSEHAGGKYLADTLDTALAIVASAKQAGLTQSFGTLPVFAEKGVWLLHPKSDEEGHLLSSGISMVTPFVNTTRVKPEEEPKALKDLLDPKWKGQKIAIGSPVTDPLIIYWYVAKLADDNFFTQLAKQELLITPTVRDSAAVLSRGEAAITFPQSDTTAASLIARGAPMKPIELAEGVVGSPGVAMAMVKNAPHPNATRLFANWILSKEGQTVFHKARTTVGTRTDIPNFLPPAAVLTYKKVTMLGLSGMLDVSRIQREGTVAKLMGIEK